jgi:phenylalanyl-tRNA synthetase beta chain
VTVEIRSAAPATSDAIFDNVQSALHDLLRGAVTTPAMRPISNVVDVTNYVMLALGTRCTRSTSRRSRRHGESFVRRAQGRERRSRQRSTRRAAARAEDLMIADAERSVALAGDHGRGRGRPRSRDDTNEVCSRRELRADRRSSALRAAAPAATEGSNRWEKGVDPYLAERPPTSATQLLAETAGATWDGRRRRARGLPERPVIRFRPSARTR